MVLLCRLTEYLLVFYRRLYKKIESSLWLYTGKSQLFQSLIQSVPVPVIVRNIGLCIQAFSHCPLHKRRSVYKSQDSGGHICSALKVCGISSLIWYYQIADALSWKGQGFAEG